MRSLNKYATFCMELLRNINIPFEEPVAWTVNTRATRRWGQCRRRYNGYYYAYEYHINISSLLLDERASEKDLIETILHELIHTCPGCMNHGHEWKTYADVVNRKYGYNISRLKKGEEESAALMIENKKANANYVCVCEKCGHEFFYSRRCGVIENPSRYTHTKCGGHLKLKASKKQIYAHSGWWDKNVTADYKVIN